jgi:signal transduction histidine kinase
MIVILTFNCFFFNSLSQNKALADSCWHLLLENNTESDSVRLSLLAKVAFNQTNPDSIVYYAEYLINEASDKSNALFLAKGYYYKGCGLRLLSKKEEAIVALFKSIKISLSINNPLLTSGAYLEISNVYSLMKNHIEAVKYIEKGIELLKKLNNESVLSGAYLNLGGEYLDENKLDLALSCFYQADSLYLKLNDITGAAYAKGNIGIILAKQGSIDSARVKLFAACNVLQMDQNYHAVGVYKLWLSIVEQKSKNFPLALNYANDCLRSAFENGLNDQIRDANEQLARIYVSMGRYQEAITALKQFYAYRDSIVNTETITQIANLRTEFEVGQKQAELDAMADSERFKSRMLWGLFIALALVAALLLIVYRNYKLSKRLSLQLQIQKQELEMANATKDRFFSVISHDLRGPIGAIGNLVLLSIDAMDNHESKDLKSLLQMTGECNREVETLLNSLLHWSLSQRGIYQKRTDKVDFNQLINGVIDIYKPIAQAKGVNLVYQQNAHLCQIETDMNSWAVIVRNLINNAIKFTHSGGQVEIMVDQQPNQMALTVTDTGIGMDPQFAQTLFSSPINQSQWGTNREKGMGIGLSLVKDFVDLNYGTIEVSSQVGHGTTFKVVIPVMCG